MASTLRIITSNLVTRSFVVPTLISSASRFLSIDTCHRSYSTTTSTDEFYDQSCPRLLWPGISSMCLDMELYNDHRELLMYINLSKESDGKGLLAILNGNGLEKKDMRACAEQMNTFPFLIQDKTHNAPCLEGRMKLRENTSGDVKEEMKDGMLKVTPPNEDEFRSNIMVNILVNDIIASFRDITTKRSWPYHDMFYDRTIICKRLFPIIARMSPINSFEIHNGEHANCLSISMDIPGRSVKTRLITQGLCVSLEMRGLTREDVKTYFYDRTFIVEGKIGKNSSSGHYVAGIHLPKGFQKKHNMVKKEMKGGVFYAIIPYVKKRGDQDQLKKTGDQEEPYIYQRISTTSYNNSMQTNDFFDQSWVRNLCPKDYSSIGARMEMADRYTGLTLFIADEDSVYMDIPTPEIEDDTWLIRGEKNKECFLSGLKLPNMNDGKLIVTLPNQDEIMANMKANIITSFRGITAKGSWPYYDMFYDRTILGERFCPLFTMLPHINSFSVYKQDTAKGLYIYIDMPGKEKMELTTQGLHVSLDMRRQDREDNRIREPKREDIKTFFDYDTFFIEVKTNNEHYIKGIHLPEGVHKKNNVIKKWMKDGVFYAFVPRVEKEKAISSETFVES